METLELIGSELKLVFQKCHFLIQGPIFLILKFNRKQHENFAKVSKEIIKFFKELERNLLISWFQKSEQNKYQLMATINSSHDSSTRSNHFTAALFDSKILCGQLWQGKALLYWQESSRRRLLSNLMRLFLFSRIV